MKPPVKQIHETTGTPKPESASLAQHLRRYSGSARRRLVLCKPASLLLRFATLMVVAQFQRFALAQPIIYSGVLVELNAAGKPVLTWRAGDTLQWTPVLGPAASWTPVPEATSPYVCNEVFDQRFWVATGTTNNNPNFPYGRWPGGFVNLTLKPGLNLICNPLDAGPGKNTVSNVLAGLPDGSTVYKYTMPSGYVVNDYTTLFGWSDPNMSLAPGEGVLVHLPPGPDKTVPCIGTVLCLALTNNIPQGASLVGSKVPQAGTLTQLGLPGSKFSDYDNVLCFDRTTQSWKISTYIGGWDTEPQPAVGEAFGTLTDGPVIWIRNFSPY